MTSSPEGRRGICIEGVEPVVDTRAGFHGRPSVGPPTVGVLVRQELGVVVLEDPANAMLEVFVFHDDEMVSGSDLTGRVGIVVVVIGLGVA